MVRYSHTGQTSFGPLHQSRWTTPAPVHAPAPRGFGPSPAARPFCPSTSTGRWETGRANTGARSPPAPHGAQWPRLSQRLCVSPRCPSAPRRPRPGGPAHLLHRGLQHLPICGPVHGQHRVEAWERPRADHRDVGTIGLRDRIDAAFPSRRPATHACHRALEPRLGNALVARDGEGRPQAVIGSPCLRDARRGARPRGTPLFFAVAPDPGGPGISSGH